MCGIRIVFILYFVLVGMYKVEKKNSALHKSYSESIKILKIF